MFAQGRRTFLRTIEIDINRAESYGKKLQREFEREFETLETCNSILRYYTLELFDVVIANFQFFFCVRELGQFIDPRRQSKSSSVVLVCAHCKLYSLVKFTVKFRIFNFAGIIAKYCKYIHVVIHMFANISYQLQASIG